MIDEASLLRAHLIDYEQAMMATAEQLAEGERAVAAIQGTGKATQSRQVTEAIHSFEAARHQLRLALFAVGKEEGTTIGEIGRILGISRQLASRLAGQADT